MLFSFALFNFVRFVELKNNVGWPPQVLAWLERHPVASKVHIRGGGGGYSAGGFRMINKLKI